MSKLGILASESVFAESSNAVATIFLLDMFVVVFSSFSSWRASFSLYSTFFVYLRTWKVSYVYEGMRSVFCAGSFIKSVLAASK